MYFCASESVHSGSEKELGGDERVDQFCSEIVDDQKVAFKNVLLQFLLRGGLLMRTAKGRCPQNSSNSRNAEK